MAEILDFDTLKNKKAPPIDAEMVERKKEAISKLPGYRGEVNSKNQIRQLPEVQPGQIFWVAMDNKAYLVAEKDKQKMTIKALDETATISTGMTIYDMNKGIVSKEPLFDWEDGEAVTRLNDRIIAWFSEETQDEFYLLYGRDIHYVSLFKKQPEHHVSIVETLRETLFNIGDLISMDFNTSDGEPSIEIWIRTADSAAELLYLFPYDRGIISL